MTTTPFQATGNRRTTVPVDVIIVVTCPECREEEIYGLDGDTEEWENCGEVVHRSEL